MCKTQTVYEDPMSETLALDQVNRAAGDTKIIQVTVQIIIAKAAYTTFIFKELSEEKVYNDIICHVVASLAI